MPRKARGKPGPKPGFQPVVNQRRAAAKAAAEAKRPRDPLQRSRDIRTMVGDDLKAYAKQIGVRAIDIETLTEDRLRQNCALTVASLVDQLTE